MTRIADLPLVEVSSKNPPEFNGWKPPIIYDIAIDAFRLATQADIDNFMEMTKAYGQIRQHLKDIEAIHVALAAARERVE